MLLKPVQEWAGRIFAKIGKKRYGNEDPGKTSKLQTFYF